MRILWHAVAPWHKTGYGIQTALFAPRLAGLGHEVVLSCMGRRGVDDNPERRHPDSTLHTGQWEGLRAIGPGRTEFGPPTRAVVREAFGGHDPDLVLVLKDPFVLDPAHYQPWNTAVWCNIDCEPMGVPDQNFYRASGARPIAVSQFGLSMMRKAGLRGAMFIPHGVDQAAWTGEQTRAAARDLLGLPQHAYIAGINASNIGPRKGWGEQLGAFATFHMKLQPESLLLIHTVPEHPEGISLRHLAAALGITDCVLFGSHTNMRGPQLASWYRSLDVLLNCTYGEGFCVPVAEALACGTPVVATDCTALTEKITTGCGYLVSAQRWWNPYHQAWWHIPREREITAKMSRRLGPVLAPLRDRYDADMITREYWKPALEVLA